MLFYTKYYKNSGFREVLDLTNCSPSDKYYYQQEAIDPYDRAINVTVDVEQEKISGVYTYSFPIHSSIQHYARIFAANTKNGRYYTLERINDIVAYNTFAQSEQGKNLIAHLVSIHPNEDSYVEEMKNTIYKNTNNEIYILLNIVLQTSYFSFFRFVFHTFFLFFFSKLFKRIGAGFC